MFAKNVQPRVLVIMPFDQKFDSLFYHGIQQVCEELEVICERVHERLFEPKSLYKIHQQITQTDLIIADVSEQTIDIFYELGYSSALGKKMIFLSKGTDSLSAKFPKLSVIVYQDAQDLHRQFKQKIVSYLGTLEERRRLGYFPLQFSLSGQILEPDRLTNLNLFVGSKGSSCFTKTRSGDPIWKKGFTVSLTINNPTNLTFDKKFELALIGERPFFIGKREKASIPLSEDEFLQNIDLEHKPISAKTWELIKIKIIPDDWPEEACHIFRCWIRLFTGVGFRDFPIKICINW